MDCNTVDSARASQYRQLLLGLLKEVEIRPKKETKRYHSITWIEKKRTIMGRTKAQKSVLKERHTETYDVY